MRSLILRRVGYWKSAGGPIIVGHTGQADVLRLEVFLRRNGQPHRVLDSESDPCGRTLVERFQIDPHHLPMVICPNGKTLRNPSEKELARCIGLVRPIDPGTLYDVAIVGAGPAGLAAAVYAASEGLSVIVLDCRSFGGQAGASARIENYLGFPTGISGLALMARAYNQAQKFGVEMAIPDEVSLLGGGTGHESGTYVLHVGEGEILRARAVVVASGARYRRLEMKTLPSSGHPCVGLPSKLDSVPAGLSRRCGQLGRAAAVYWRASRRGVALARGGSHTRHNVAILSSASLPQTSRSSRRPKSPLGGTAMRGTHRWRHRTSEKSPAQSGTCFCS